MVIPSIKPVQSLENQVMTAIHEWLLYSQEYGLVSVTSRFGTLDNNDNFFIGPQNIIKVLFHPDFNIDDALANFISFLNMPNEWVDGDHEPFFPDTLNGECYRMTLNNLRETLIFSVWFTNEDVTTESETSHEEMDFDEEMEDDLLILSDNLMDFSIEDDDDRDFELVN